MKLKLSGLLFVAFNIVLLYLQFCTLWAKINLLLAILCYICGFIAAASINQTDKAFYALGQGDLNYKSTFKTWYMIGGLIGLIKCISSIILGIYFLINL